MCHHDQYIGYFHEVKFVAKIAGLDKVKIRYADNFFILGPEWMTVDTAAALFLHEIFYGLSDLPGFFFLRKMSAGIQCDGAVVGKTTFKFFQMDRPDHRVLHAPDEQGRFL